MQPDLRLMISGLRANWKLSRGPGERASAKQVQMEMIDGLAAVFARVDDDAVALGEIFLAGDFCRSPEQVSEERGVMRPGFGERDDVFARHNQDVDGSFGPDISEGVAFVVLKNRRGGDASFNDFAEEAAHDGISVQEGQRSSGAGGKCAAGLTFNPTNGGDESNWKRIQFLLSFKCCAQRDDSWR